MREPGELLSTIDAKVWADEFMETKARLGEKGFDRNVTLGWFTCAIMAGYQKATRRQQDTIADLQGQLLGWKRALHSLTPGGSEYANDSKACVEWVREARSRQHEAIIDGVKQRNALQQRVADLQGQLATAKAPRVYDCGSCAIGKGFEQRVAQLEGKLAKAERCVSEWVDRHSTYFSKLELDFGKQAEALSTLQADHARVLGLVRETVEFFDSNFENAGLELCGLLDGKEITYTGRRLNELIEQLAASLPAQPAQGGAKCVWVDDGGGTYATGCKEYFQVYAESEEAPQWVKFCCYCGKSVEHFADAEGETRA